MTSSYHARIGDHRLSFGMVRYSTGQKDDDKHLWKLVVTKYCNGEIYETFEPTYADLSEIKRFCDRAIEILETDGGRNDK